MPIQSRNYTLDELIAEFRDTMTQEGRSTCPVTEHLEANRGKWTIADAEHWIATDPTYGPLICSEIIRTAGTHNNPATTGEIQRLYAGYLVAFPWRISRHWIEKLLHAEVPHGIDDEALKALLDHLDANHPNPKALLAKREVARRLPAHIDLTGFKAPSFPEIEAQALRGGGLKHPDGVSETFKA